MEDISNCVCICCNVVTDTHWVMSVKSLSIKICFALEEKWVFLVLKLGWRGTSEVIFLAINMGTKI